MKSVAETIEENKKAEGKNVLGFEIKNIEISFDYVYYCKLSQKEKNKKSQSVKK